MLKWLDLSLDCRMSDEWSRRSAAVMEAQILGVPPPDLPPVVFPKFSDRKRRLFAIAVQRLARINGSPEGLIEQAEAIADGAEEPNPKILSPLLASSAPYAVKVMLHVHDLVEEQSKFADAMRDIVGDPWRRVSVRPDPRSVAIAEVIYRERDLASLPVLADSLEEGGPCDEALLAHLRSAGPHFKGCWALDLVLGRS